MNLKDQEKVLKAGIAIIRKAQVDKRRAIKIKTNENPKWHILEAGFLTKWERDQRMKKLLNEPHIIED